MPRGCRGAGPLGGWPATVVRGTWCQALSLTRPPVLWSVPPGVIPGEGKCLYWAPSAVDGAGGQAAAQGVRRALTEGDMARPQESGWARRVMGDAGVRTWDQYLDKVRRGEIWRGACEVGRWAQSKGCRVAMYQEWGPRGVYRKMAEVGEGKRTPVALLWCRRGGGHYELRVAPERGGSRGSGGGRRRGRGRVDRRGGNGNGGGVGRRGSGEGGGGEEGGRRSKCGRMCIKYRSKGRSERLWQQGQEGPGRERRGVRAGTARDRKLRAGWEGQLGVQVREIEYVEVPEGTGKGEWRRRQAGGVDV